MTIDGNSGKLQNNAAGTRFYGGQGSFTNHWIVITGISNSWIYGTDQISDKQSRDRTSPYNWLRVYNPFDNETEYYWWRDLMEPSNGRGAALGDRALIIK